MMLRTCDRDGKVFGGNHCGGAVGVLVFILFRSCVSITQRETP
jgi:hypothetical protein